jgi:phosphate butyryltransferase
MSLPSFAQLFARADQLQPRVPVVAAGGADPTVLEALSQAATRGWVQPIVTGDQPEIARTAASVGVSLESFRVISAAEPAAAAVAEIRASRARYLMKGQLPTPDLMKAVLSAESGLRQPDRVVAQVVLMEIRRDQRSFLMTDTGITIAPNLQKKTDLLRGLIEVASRLTADRQGFQPRIALMSATEKVNPQIPDTLDAEQLTQLAAAGEFGPAIVQGPLSFDLAYAADAGEKKRLDGGVIGQADAMLFPDLLSANLTVKAIMYTADCQFGGLLMGTSAPVVFMSRADTTATRLNSLALTLAANDFR